MKARRVETFAVYCDCGSRGDRRAVEATAQVADNALRRRNAPTNRVDQAIPESSDHVGRSCGAGRHGVDLPVLDLAATPCVEDDCRRRWDPFDAIEERPAGLAKLLEHVLGDGVGIRSRRRARRDNQLLRLGSQTDCGRIHLEEEGLHPEAITHRHRSLFLVVPDDEREIPVDAVKAIDAGAAKGLQDEAPVGHSDRCPVSAGERSEPVAIPQPQVSDDRQVSRRHHPGRCASGRPHVRLGKRRVVRTPGGQLQQRIGGGQGRASHLPRWPPRVGPSRWRPPRLPSASVRGVVRRRRIGELHDGVDDFWERGEVVGDGKVEYGCRLGDAVVGVELECPCCMVAVLAEPVRDQPTDRCCWSSRVASTRVWWPAR